MSMNGNDLGDLLLATVNTAAGLTLGDRQALYRAFGNAIVNYLKANAVVTVTTSTPGVTVGPATAPGTGSGTIA